MLLVVSSDYGTAAGHRSVVGVIPCHYQLEYGVERHCLPSQHHFSKWVVDNEAHLCVIDSSNEIIYWIIDTPPLHPYPHK